MLILHTFGPAFGLPDPSPFCIKAMALLKLSGLEHRCVRGDVRKAPKRKLPILVDGDETIPDTTFIRWHLEEKHGVSFDDHLTDEQKAVAWAFEKLCEDNLYWIVVHERWLVPANFDRGPRQFFAGIPALVRPLIVSQVRRQIKRDLHGQGTGRHSEAERQRIMSVGLKSLSDYLGDKPYFMGDVASSVDAMIFAAVASAACDWFDTPTRAAIAKHPNLLSYGERLRDLWFPETGRS